MHGGINPSGYYGTGRQDHFGGGGQPVEINLPNEPVTATQVPTETPEQPTTMPAAPPTPKWWQTLGHPSFHWFKPSPSSLGVLGFHLTQNGKVQSSG